MKAVFGEYAAYTTPGGIRFQKNNKLVSVRAVPTEVVSFLEGKLSGERGQVETTEYTPPAAATDVPADFYTGEPSFTSVKEGGVRSVTESSDVPIDFTPPDVDTDFIESISIHTAPIHDMAQALYERFGLYTVYLNQLPKPDEINPLTGEGFTKYHLGIAYQAAIRAQSSGLLTRNPESNRAVIDEGRDASRRFTVDPVPQTMGEARRANTFDYRTSVVGNESRPATQIVHQVGADGQVHAVQVERPLNGTSTHRDEREDELIVEPNFSGKPVIRPDW